MAKNYATLKHRQRSERDSYHVNLSLRVHRALSWLNKAEQCSDDDAKYIFLWIAFNAAYANEIEAKHRPCEQEIFRNFLKRLNEIDQNSQLYGLVWKSYSHTIRILLDNKYVFEPFWDYQRGTITEIEWQNALNTANDSANRALGDKDTVKVLSIILKRCYTLRNQLIHGGATWKSKANRDQVRDCTHLLSELVPTVIELMMDGKDLVWGDSVYPNLKL